MVQTLVLHMAYVVPLAFGELGAEPLNEGLLGRGRKHEVWSGRIVCDRTVLEEVGGKEEGKDGIDDAYAAGERVAEGASRGGDCAVLDNDRHEQVLV